MADITSSSPVILMAVPSVLAQAKAEESKIVSFVKAHWAKAVAAVVGFGAAHFGVITTVLAIIKKVL